uniref:Carbon monoxide dehydrogenase medium subunit n=1 Tax=Thermogemmatispora argillosa TaxID=2045280 RepID=A0A455SXN9_9CHLR|nr:carbon monoxide dehydrogenase medium subunit [Thermogemmatispora argillosa]
MARHIPVWLAPTSLEEALELRARYGEEATVVAGGTFVGILMNQGLLQPAALLSLRQIPQLTYLRVEDAQASGQPLLRIGAMTTHRALERSPLVQRGWPVVAATFALVASPRVRNQATVGGVLADADYASDPPALLHALEASVVARSLQGERLIPVEELIIGHYETSLRPDELLIEIRVPGAIEGAVYRKFRSRSSEDRPCVAVAAVRRGGRLRVTVGAVAERPQYFPGICALAEGQAFLEPALAREIGERYAAAIEPISDARGSAHYRRRVIAVEVRRALEDLNRMLATEGGSQRHA